MIKKNKKKNVFLDKSKSDFYINNRIRHKFSDLAKSTKKILLKSDINYLSVLDVGCGAGYFYLALKEKFNIQYTGIDIDPICINFANKNYGKSAKFKKLDIFDKKIKKKSFDVVMIWSLFYMLPNWRDILIRACEISKKYVMFDNKIRYDGGTVIDKDISYQYYHLSNKRNYYIVHNIHELVSFFQIHELNLENVYGYGYNLPGKTSARLPLKNSETKVGAFLLKKSTKKIIRTGVTAKAAEKSWLNINLEFPNLKLGS